MIKKILGVSIACFLTFFTLIGQEKDTLEKSVKTISQQIEILSKVKVSGFIQSQFQTIESAGAECISGGDFPKNTNKRFMMRRGRLKATFNSNIAEYVFQIDGTEEGVSVDEIYVEIKEPWLKTFSLTTGIFDRPFSFEVPYSSSKIEYTERTRILKSLIQDEKDFGVMISIHPSGNSLLNMFALDAGLFNGTGPSHRDFDNRKDFITHFTVSKSFLNDKVSANFGVSYNRGGFDNQRTFHYEWNNGFNVVGNDSLALAKRSFKGLDAQLSADWSLGTTQLRGEYIFGTQSGTALSSQTPSVAPVDDNGNPTPAYIRQFNGGYFLFLHDIVKTKFQLVVKYDWYDPNSQVKGIEIGLLPNTGKIDIAYYTLGFGLNYSLTNNIRVLGYYEKIKNEDTSVAGYTSDLKDNVFTLRLQCKF